MSSASAIEGSGVQADVGQLLAVLRGRRIAVLTGAGISTESGIPDYRGPLTRLKPRTPIQHRAFVGDAQTRARYWARSALGWPRFRAFTPNAAHHALASLPDERLSGLITQNVDRLHQKAGSREVIELHGSLYVVRCLACGATEPRDSLQERLLEGNPAISAWQAELAPDGDADLADALLRDFVVPECTACRGVLKPDVVFFGDNVPAERVARAMACVEAAEALLVIGSSLHVYSGYRFALRAAERGVPIALINLGETRADPLAATRLEAPAGVVVPALVRALRPT